MQIYIPGLFDPAGSGPAFSWEEDLALPGAAQIQLVKKVLQDRKAYPNLIPENGLIVGDAGKDDHRTIAMTGEDCVLVYTPTGQEFVLNLDNFYGNVSNDDIRASWYNPIQGIYTDMELAERQISFKPPVEEDHPDWVLVLETIGG